MSVERGFSINKYLVFLKIFKGIFFTSFVGIDIIIKSVLIFEIFFQDLKLFILEQILKLI